MSAALGRATVAALVALAFGAAIVLAATGDDRLAAARSTSSWSALTPSPLQRSEVGAARVGDRIYVVGGFASTGQTTGRMVRYDISANRWREVAELPVAVNHPGVTAYRGRVYVLGGNFGAAVAGQSKSNRLYRYTPAQDRWKRLPSATIHRGALALVGKRDRLYAIGGYTDSNDQVRRVEIYEISDRRWRVGKPMPTGRNHLGAAAIAREIYVTGGRPGPEHGGLATVERYDTARDRWSTLASMSTARSGHATVAAGGRIVAFGGEELDGGTTIEQVEAYDAVNDRWQPLPEMVTPRHGLGGVARGGRIFALEGGPQPGLAFSAAIEYLDLP